MMGRHLSLAPKDNQNHQRDNRRHPQPDHRFAFVLDNRLDVAVATEAPRAVHIVIPAMAARYRLIRESFSHRSPLDPTRTIAHAQKPPSSHTAMSSHFTAPATQPPAHSWPRSLRTLWPRIGRFGGRSQLHPHRFHQHLGVGPARPCRAPCGVIGYLLSFILLNLVHQVVIASESIAATAILHLALVGVH